MDENLEVLYQIRDLQKRQLRMQRISAIAIMGILIVISVAVYVMVPKAMTTLSHIDKVAVEADETLDDVSGMIAEITTASKSINSLVKDNAQDLTEAVEHLSGIDFEGLNAAINDLRNTVGPLASFFGKFK